MKPTGRVKQILAAIVLCLLSAVANVPTASAGPQQSSSANYGVSEVNFGSGGSLDTTCGTAYCAKQSVGELTVGNTSSTNYQAQGGFNTNREELLEVTVNGGTINLGNVDITGPKSGSTTFSIRNYLASGYIVTMSGIPPANGPGGHQIAAMSTADISRPGQEQFGVNLVANTTPSVGANPAQVPDATFSFGTAASGYNIANTFKFVSGDTIAQSPSSSGVTNFTLSTIENVATSTPEGAYKTNLIIGVIPTF